MANQVKNMLIGLFVIVACSLIVGIILFLEPTVGDGKEKLIVRFSNVNGLNIGTRVLFAGKPVGEVVEIQQIPNAREQPTDDVGQVYFYQLILSIDSSVRVFNTDEITVQTSGLLGEKSIAIVPKAAPKGIKPRQITVEQPLYAQSVDPLESAFNELQELSEKVEEAFDKVITWLDQNGDDISQAVRSFDTAMSQVNLAVSRANDLDLIGDLSLNMTTMQTTLKSLQRTMDELKDEDTFTNLGKTVKNLTTITAALKTTSEQIDKGKGTLGKLIYDEDFYLRTNAILSKVDTMMNDVNNYGVLFNLNKHWQRTRVQRVSAMNALNTPQNFKSYFEGEIDLINTSMGRISMLIDKAQDEPNAKQILQSKSFKKDFLELMRQVEELSNNLKLYNQQLAESLNDGGS